MKRRAICGLLGLVACTPENDLSMTLSVPSPIAVGATVTMKVDDACTSSNDKNCSTQTVRVIERSVSNPTDFQVVGDKVTALFEGTGTLRVVASNSQKQETLEVPVRALEADRATFRLQDDCKGGRLFGTNAKFNVAFERFRGNEKLFGTGNAPFVSDVAKVRDGAEGYVTFVTADAPATGSVRTTKGTGSIPLEVFGIERVSAVEISEAFRSGRAAATVQTSVRVGEDTPCAEDFPRTFEALTPEICAVRINGSKSAEVVARRTGACSLAVSVGAIRSTRSFEVVATETVDAGATDGGDGGVTDGGVADGGADGG